MTPPAPEPLPGGCFACCIDFVTRTQRLVVQTAGRVRGGGALTADVGGAGSEEITDSGSSRQLAFSRECTRRALVREEAAMVYSKALVWGHCSHCPLFGHETCLVTINFAHGGQLNCLRNGLHCPLAAFAVGQSSELFELPSLVASSAQAEHPGEGTSCPHPAPAAQAAVPPDADPKHPQEQLVAASPQAVGALQCTLGCAATAGRLCPHPPRRSNAVRDRQHAMYPLHRKRHAVRLLLRHRAA